MTPPRWRHARWLAACAALLLIAVSVPSASRTAPPADQGAPGSPFELWLFLFNTFKGDAASTEVARRIVDRAAAAGYTGMVLGIGHRTAQASAPGTPTRAEYWRNARDLVRYARRRGIRSVAGIFPLGRSQGILASDPNLAEGSPVRKVRMRVTSDRKRAELLRDFSKLRNGNFETMAGNCFQGWDCWDPHMSFADSSEFRPGGSGHVSARLQRNSIRRTHARIRQLFAVKSWTLYHVRYWAKAEQQIDGVPVGGNAARPEMGIYGWDRATNSRRGPRSLRTPAPSPVWKEYHALVNSGDNAELEIILSTGQNLRGTVWFDDLRFEEVAFVNLVRGSGGPLWVRSFDGSVSYVEGVDFDPLVDPVVANGPPGRGRGNFDLYHDPPVMTIPSSSRLAAGQEFLVDYYSVVPLDMGDYTQVAATVCGPEIDAWMEANLAAFHRELSDASGYFLEHDEIRQLNTSASCLAMQRDAGAVFASHLRKAIGLVQSLRPKPEIYIWGDMVDPFHNARPHYYQVRGDISGSWEGLSSDVVIMNWGLTRHPVDGTPGDLVNSIRWFAGLGQRQILAGYYDQGDGATAARTWLNKLQESQAPGVAGLMYTAWAGNPTQLYRELESFAEGALAHPFVAGGAQPSPDIVPPSAPTQVSTRVLSPTEVEISWTASVDNVGVAGYRIERNGAEIARTPRTNYRDSNISPGMAFGYTYHVAAYDAFQNLSAPAEVTTVTPPVILP
jgi:hypothetical protein